MATRSRSDRMAERLQRTKKHRHWAMMSSQSVTSTSASVTKEAPTETRKTKLVDVLEAGKAKGLHTEERSIASAPSRLAGESLSQRRNRINDRRQLKDSPCSSPMSSPLRSKERGCSPTSMIHGSPPRPFPNWTDSQPMEDSPPTLSSYRVESSTEKVTSTSFTKLSGDWRSRSVAPTRIEAVALISTRSTPTVNTHIQDATVEMRIDDDSSSRANQNQNLVISSSHAERSRSFLSSKAPPLSMVNSMSKPALPPSTTNSIRQASSELAPIISESIPQQNYLSLTDRSQRSILAHPPLTSAAPWSRDSLRRKPSASTKLQVVNEPLINHITNKEASMSSCSDSGDMRKLASSPSRDIDENVVGAHATTKMKSFSQGASKKWQGKADPHPESDDKQKPRTRQWPPPKQIASPSFISSSPSDNGSSTPLISAEEDRPKTPQWPPPKQLSSPLLSSTPEKGGIAQMSLKASHTPVAYMSNQGGAQGKVSWTRTTASQQHQGQSSPAQEVQQPSKISPWRALQVNDSKERVEVKQPSLQKTSTVSQQTAQETKPKSPARQWPPPQHQQKSFASWQKPSSSNSTHNIQPPVDLLSASLTTVGLTEDARHDQPWQKQEQASMRHEIGTRSEQSQVPTNAQFPEVLERKSTSSISRQTAPWAQKQETLSSSKLEPWQPQGTRPCESNPPSPELAGKEPDSLPPCVSDDRVVIETESPATVAMLRAAFGATVKRAATGVASSGSQKNGVSSSTNVVAQTWISSNGDHGKSFKAHTMQASRSLYSSDGSAALPSLVPFSPGTAQNCMNRPSSPGEPKIGPSAVLPSNSWKTRPSPLSTQSALSSVAPSAGQITSDSKKPSWAHKSIPTLQQREFYQRSQDAGSSRVQSWSAVSVTKPRQTSNIGPPRQEASDASDTISSPVQEKGISSPMGTKVTISSAPESITKDALIRPPPSQMVPRFATESPVKSLAALAADSVIRTDYGLNQLQFRDSEELYDESDSRNTSATPKKSELPIQFQSILDKSSSMENALSIESDPLNLHVSDSETEFLGPDAVQDQTSSFDRKIEFAYQRNLTSTISPRRKSPNQDIEGNRSTHESAMNDGLESSNKEGNYQLSGAPEWHQMRGSAHTTMDRNLDSSSLHHLVGMNIEGFNAGASEAGSTAISSALFHDPTSFGAAGCDSMTEQPLPVSVRAKTIEACIWGNSPTGKGSPNRAPPVLKESYRGQGMMRDDIDKKSVRFHDALTAVQMLDQVEAGAALDYPTSSGAGSEHDYPPGPLERDTAIEDWQEMHSPQVVSAHSTSPPRTPREAVSILQYFQNTDHEDVDQDRWGDQDPDYLVASRDDDSSASSANTSASDGVTEEDLMAPRDLRPSTANARMPMNSSPSRSTQRQDMSANGSSQKAMPNESPQPKSQQISSNRSQSGSSALAPSSSNGNPPQDQDPFSPRANDNFVGISSSIEQKNVFDPFIVDDDDDSFFNFGKSDNPFSPFSSRSPLVIEKTSTKISLRPPPQDASTRNRRYKEAMQASYDDDYYASRVAATVAENLKYDPYGDNDSRFEI